MAEDALQNGDPIVVSAVPERRDLEGMADDLIEPADAPDRAKQWRVGVHVESDQPSGRRLHLGRSVGQTPLPEDADRSRHLPRSGG